MVKVTDSTKKISIGKEGENCFRKIIIDVSTWRNEYPEGKITAVFQRPDGMISSVLLKEDTADRVIWEPTMAETYPGIGLLELHLTIGDVIGKSASFQTICEHSIPWVGTDAKPKVGTVLAWTQTGPAWIRGGTANQGELPVASENEVGGIFADPADSNDTQPVRIGNDNKLYTAAHSTDSTFSYEEANDKPSINGVELSGNKTAEDLGISTVTDEQVATAVETWLDAHPEATTTVADGSITYEKLDGVEVVANQIFDPVDFRTNGVTGFLNGSTGVNNSTTAIPDEYSNYMTSPYMDALPNTDYALNFWPYSLFFYDSDKVMLEKATKSTVEPVGGTEFYRITTPANTAYIRFCKSFDITTGEHETWMICEGGLLFEEYFVGKKTALNGECLNLRENTLDGMAIAEKTMPANRVKDFDILQQLFNYDEFVNKGVAGGAVTASGAISAGSADSYHCSDFVSAKAEQVYTANFRPHVNGKEYGAVACYGADKVCLGISELNSDYQFTTLSDTMYIRFGIYNFDSLEVAKSYMICEGTELFPGYAEGGDQIIVKNLLLYQSTPQNSVPGTILLDGSIPASKLAPADGLKILCYGDSLTQNLYPAKVATLLNAEVTDAGIGGNTVAQIYNRVGNYGTDFSVVTLMCGTNDNGGQTSCPLGTADDEAATDDNATASDTTYAARFKRLLNKIKTTHRGATFVIMPPFEHAWSGLEPVANLMQEIAKQYKMPYLDIYHLCGWDGRDAEDKSIFMSDDTHENAVGAQRIAELLAGFIRQLNVL